MTTNQNNMDELIRSELHKAFDNRDYTIKLTEQGMNTAQIIYPEGFKDGFNRCLELKNKEFALKEEQIKMTKEALGFYGNIENWRNPKYPQKHDFNVLDSEDGRDVDAIKGGHLICGKRARECLKKLEEK